MPTTEKTYQSILRKLSRVSVDALPQIDLYLQRFVVEKKTAKKKPAATPAIEMPTNQCVSDEEVLVGVLPRICPRTRGADSSPQPPDNMIDHTYNARDCQFIQGLKWRKPQ